MFMFRKIVRGCGYFVAGLFIGALLWAIGTPAFAQVGDKPPVVAPPLDGDKPPSSFPIPDRPAARIVFTTAALQLFGIDGREKVALTPAGVELSDGATIDFSPDMVGQRNGDLKALVRVRVGGRVYVLQAFEDPDVPQRGQP